MGFSQKFCDWASMARLPNVPTVWSNVFTAWVLGGCGFEEPKDIRRFVFAIIAGTTLYTGGAMLSEVADIEFDRQYRTERSLPAGRISRLLARSVAMALLLTGVALLGAIKAPLWTVGWVFVSILLYAGLHKRTGYFSAVLMALCRVSLGLAIAYAASEDGRLGDGIPGWFCMLGCYVAGVSLLARGESKPMKESPYVPMYLMFSGVLIALTLLVNSCNGEATTAILFFTAGMIWVGFPLRQGAGKSSCGQAVGRALVMMPAVDEIALQLGNIGPWANVPMACIVLAWVLQRFASAT